MLIKLKTTILTLAFSFSSFWSFNINAAFIDFDDLPPPAIHPWICYTGALGCEHELGNEYAALGIEFVGDREWLVSEELSDGSYNNILQGFNFIGVSFTKERPNFVSFNINSATGGEASFIEVYGLNNKHLFTHATNGWRGREDLSTPYIPNQFVSIYSEELITGLAFYSFYNRGTGPSIDNFSFEYREVPEPAPAVLIGLGLFMLMYRRYILRSAK